MFFISVSFHKAEDGFDHQTEMPKVPGPEDLPSEKELRQRLLTHLPANIRSYWERERPIEMRPVDVSRYLDAGEERSPCSTSGCAPTARSPTIRPCINACWPMRPISRFSTPR